VPQPVRVYGRRRTLARRLAVVEQDVSTHDHVTVRQVVELGRTPFRGRFDALTAHDQKIIDAALERADVADRQHRDWHTLSGGEKQRTQLARAPAQEPREILLDEPTNHLGIRHQSAEQHSTSPCARIAAPPPAGFTQAVSVCADHRSHDGRSSR
jgi:ABC-type cobalamin/Fe3+-siderophores transport system ATPase subunit